MKLLGSTENKITKDKNEESIPHLEITKVVFNNDYQRDLRVLYTIVPNKLFGSLLEISPNFQKFLQFKTIEVWFTDQNSKPLEIEDRINLTLVIK